MSFEKQTRIKPELPVDSWLVVHRISDFAYRPYTFVHADFLRSMLDTENAHSPTKVSVVEGVLYALIHTQRIPGTEALKQATEDTWRNLSRLAIAETSELETRIAPANEINPNRPIAESFFDFSDVTPEARDIVADLETQPQDDSDVYHELDLLRKQ